RDLHSFPTRRSSDLPPTKGPSERISMKAENTSSLRIVTTPPKFCEYAGGQCDQNFLDAPGSKALFLYPSQPETIASTIEEAVNVLRNTTGNPNWLTWKDLGVS